MPSSPIPPSLCPACGYLSTAAETLADPEARPDPGSISLCLSCGAIGLFADDLTIRAPYFGELEAIRTEDPVFAAELERMRLLILEQRATDPIPRRGGSA